eukprot:GHVR01147597.1.p1 GENE.GHVR01147597.1~~GHVR01147597.1.p1  ORF type:complete len:225 (+),score=35.32 GHVR01147597.1:56-730(+)
MTQTHKTVLQTLIDLTAIPILPDQASRLRAIPEAFLVDVQAPNGPFDFGLSRCIQAPGEFSAMRIACRKVKANPLRYHIGSFYFTGKKQLPVYVPEEETMMSASSYIHAVLPEGTLAKNKVLPKKEAVTRHETYITMNRLGMMLRETTDENAIRPLFQSLMDNNDQMRKLVEQDDDEEIKNKGVDSEDDAKSDDGDSSDDNNQGPEAKRQKISDTVMKPPTRPE